MAIFLCALASIKGCTSSWIRIQPTKINADPCGCGTLKNIYTLFRFVRHRKVDLQQQCWGSGSAWFWASRIRIHKSEVRIRIRLRILPFSHEQTEIMLAK